MSNGFEFSDFEEIRLGQFAAFKGTGLVTHGFTTRLGGVSESPYDKLNLALQVGDNPDSVVANRREVCTVLDSGIEHMTTCKQVHGLNVATVGLSQAGRGAFSYDTSISDTDGLITNSPGLLLATFYADCVPIFILDPVKRVVGSVHAGWKGTVGKIGAVAVQKMVTDFGSHQEDCLIGIGPSIGPCCFEVEDTVLSLFSQAFEWLPEVAVTGSSGKTTLDLWQINRRIMLEAGIKPNNIEMAGLCTCCNQQMMFSYRGSGGVTGRMGAFIGLKPSRV